MAAPVYITWNGPSTTLANSAVMSAPNTSAVAGTPKTMLQLAPLKKIRLVEWGYHFAAAPTAPVYMELIDTGTVFATVTAGVVSMYNDATGDASQAQLGTALTGYTATAEGTFAGTRLLAETFDLSTIFKQQFPLGREPEVAAGRCLRIRATPGVAAATAVSCYLIWEE
jgi:hypothetical protein